jgi:arylsulfatase A-like enzyme
METIKKISMKGLISLCNIGVILLTLTFKSYSQTNTRPNIIMVVADDQGLGDLSFLGNRFLKTPAMDKLAEQSVRFSNFIVSPVCAPTRASIMTGRYNYRAGVWDTWKGREVMHADEFTITEVLKSSGYATGFFGKWHLGYNAPSRPMDQGFDETIEFEEYTKDSANRVNPAMKRNGILEYHNGFLTDVIFDEAFSFIENKVTKNTPFFSYIASFLPHASDLPMVPPEYLEPFDTIAGLGNHTKQAYGMITLLDRKIELLLKKLDHLGIANNTLLVYLSDNGPQFGSHISEIKEIRYNSGLRGTKGTVYEGGIKVPCFMKWPGVIEPDRDIIQMAGHIDLLPTIAEYAKAQLPDVTIDGRSLVPLINNDNKKWEPRTLKIQFDRKEVPELWANSTIRGERFKLVNGQELYDLWQDPGETTNISEQNPEMVNYLKNEYIKWFEDVSSTRDFKIGQTWIGSPVQDKVIMQIFDKNSKGWPVVIMNQGPYEIEVHKVQSELFPEGGNIVITIGDLEMKKPIEKGESKVIFKNIFLPLGNFTYDINIEGYKIPKKGKWNQDDLGYGNVVIRYMQR